MVNNNGHIELNFPNSIFDGQRFKPVVIYDEDDLPDLLKGTYKLFARDRTPLPKIMDFFALHLFLKLRSLVT